MDNILWRRTICNKGLSFLATIPKKSVVLAQFCINCPIFGIIWKLRSNAIGCYMRKNSIPLRNLDMGWCFTAFRINEIKGKKTPKNSPSSEWFFSDFFNETSPIFLQNLKALAMSFSKLFLHVQKVHLLRELWTFEVCLWKTKFWVIPLNNIQIFVFIGKLW